VFASRRTLIIGAAALLAACEAPQLTSTATPTSHATAASRNGGAFNFTPLATSATCTVAGGSATNPLVLPAGFGQTIVASEPAFADAIDMNTQNESGPDRGRYLYRPSEGSVSEVSVTDLETGITKRLAFRADWESFDLIAWTPWGTLLVGEEANAQSKPDPDFPKAI